MSESIIKDNSSEPLILLQEEEYNNIFSKLKDLKILIKGGQNNDIKKTNIYEYILYPELFNFNELKNKIFTYFNVENNEQLYKQLLEKIKDLFKEKQSIRNSQEEISLRGHFYKILDYLNFFIGYSLIYSPNNDEIKNKSFEYFIKWIIYDNSITKTSLISYINVFNLKDLLFNFYSIKRDIFLSISDISRIFALISILNMKNIYSVKYIIKTKNKNFFAQFSNVFELYRTYNSSLREIYELTDYLISLKRNWIEPVIIEKILNEADIEDKLDNQIKILLIENLMINYSLIKENEKNKEKEILSYYRILLKYLNIIPKNYFINWEAINYKFKNFIENKEYDKCINFINGIQDISIINKNIDNNLIKTLVISIPIGKILLISDLIKSNKNLISYILKYNRSKDGIRLIKALKLNKNEYDNLFDEISMNSFFIYKINSCTESFDILMDYGLINESTYNKLLYKLMKKSYNGYLERNNNISYNISNDNWLSLNEEEGKVNQNNNINENNNFEKLSSFFLKESIKKEKMKLDKKKINILTQIDKEKILTLIHFAKLKNFNFSNINQNLFNKIFSDISINNYAIDYS